jgi:8-oxo-dGTP diphosphatase
MSTFVQQVAAKAVIVDDHNRVLIVREAPLETRSHVGQYQIVGGRIDPGETFEDALRREVKEEVGIEVEILDPLYVGEWRPKVKGVQYQIIAIFVVCRAKSKDVVLSEEHDHYVWLDPAKRTQVDLMEPDCYVVDTYAARVK